MPFSRVHLGKGYRPILRLKSYWKIAGFFFVFFFFNILWRSLQFLKTTLPPIKVFHLLLRSLPKKISPILNKVITVLSILGTPRSISYRMVLGKLDEKDPKIRTSLVGKIFLFSLKETFPKLENFKSHFPQAMEDWASDVE